MGLNSNPAQFFFGFDDGAKLEISVAGAADMVSTVSLVLADGTIAKSKDLTKPEARTFKQEYDAFHSLVMAIKR